MEYFSLNKRYFIYLNERTLQIVGECAAIGMGEIDRASLTPLDQLLLRTWWSHKILMNRNMYNVFLNVNKAQTPSRIELIPGYVSLMECLRSERQAENMYDTMYETSYIRVSDLFRSFSGDISLPLGIMTVDISGREGTIEATFGEGVQYTVGWNLKKHLPIVGIGYGINLGNIVNVGAVVKYSPSSGLSGVVDLGAAEPLPILHSGGWGSPRIPIAKVGRFTN